MNRYPTIQLVMIGLVSSSFIRFGLHAHQGLWQLGMFLTLACLLYTLLRQFQGRHASMERQLVDEYLFNIVFKVYLGLWLIHDVSRHQWVQVSVDMLILALNWRGNGKGGRDLVKRAIGEKSRALLAKISGHREPAPSRI